MENAYLNNLPVEILHRVFDYCDVQTILCKIGCVCKRLRAVAYQYNRFHLRFDVKDTRLIKHLFHLISEDSIVSLDISFKEAGCRIFNELVRKSNIRFTRLRHLIVRNVTRKHLERLFANMNYIDSISLTIDSYCSPWDFKLPKFSLWIMKSNLQKLCWKEFDYRVNNISWSIPCKLTHLTINSCLYGEYLILLEQLPCLQTLQLNKCILNTEDMSIPSTNVSFSSQLTCLIIAVWSLPIDHLISLIFKTPQLRHLKLISYENMVKSVVDIHEWEKFIRTELNSLDKCEFFISIKILSNDMISLPSLIAPFQEPFWLDEKRWFIVCEYLLGHSTLYLYTIPTDIYGRYYNGSSYGILYKDDSYHLTERLEKEIVIDVSNRFELSSKYYALLLCSSVFIMKNNDILLNLYRHSTN